MKKLILLSGAALILSSSLAMAGNGKNMPRNFESFDSNNDGLITQAEGTERFTNKFAQIDSNNDGQITKAEFEQRMGQKKGHKHNKSDKKSAAKDYNSNNTTHNDDVYDSDNDNGRNEDQ